MEILKPENVFTFEKITPLRKNQIFEKALHRHIAPHHTMSHQINLTHAQRTKRYSTEAVARNYARRCFPTVQLLIVHTNGDRYRITKPELYIFSFETVVYRGLGGQA